MKIIMDSKDLYKQTWKLFWEAKNEEVKANLIMAMAALSNVAHIEDPEVKGVWEFNYYNLWDDNEGHIGTVISSMHPDNANKYMEVFFERRRKIIAELMNEQDRIGIINLFIEELRIEGFISMVLMPEDGLNVVDHYKQYKIIMDKRGLRRIK
jgi:hypothetical protein